MKSFNGFLRKLRAVNSLLLVFTAIPVALSSVYLYIAPFDAAGRTTWNNLHLFLGFVLIVSFVIHGAMNWRAIRSYLRQKTHDLVRPRGEGLIALSIFVVLLLGVVSLPAFRVFMQGDTGYIAQSAADISSCGQCPFLRSYGSCHSGTVFSFGNVTYTGSDSGESFIDDGSGNSASAGTASGQYLYYGAN